MHKKEMIDENCQVDRERKRMQEQRERERKIKMVEIKQRVGDMKRDAERERNLSKS